MKKKPLIMYSISILLLIGIGFSLFNVYKLYQILNEKPEEIVVANITSTSAQIYWKGEYDTVPTLLYTESSSSEFKKASSLEILNDNLSDLNIYTISIDNLDSNTKYTFEIQTENKTWGIDSTEYSFSTKALSDEPSMLDAVTGKSNPEDLVLIKTENSNYILDTQYHGTWALDLDEKYTASVYGNYMPSSEFTEYSRSTLLGTAPVYASSGANCKTGSSASYSKASKSIIVDLATRWTTSCSKGSYASECYSDVICRASSSGIDPAFALTIWLNESDASNYAYNSSVQDFGINGGGVSNADFSAQLNRFLSIVSKGTAYLKSNSKCGYDSAISSAKSASSAYDPELIVWGAIYLTGNGCNTSKGLTYISGIAKVYNWVTGSTLEWPLNKTTNISGCTFTSANSGYNTCSSTGTSNSSSGNNNNGSGNSNSSSDGIACGNYGCTQDSDCEGWGNGNGDYECNERSDGNASKQKCVRYKCPTGYKISSDKCTCEPVEEEKPEKEVCCLTAEGKLEMIGESKCNGNIQEKLDENSCKTSTQKLDLNTGVNFVTFELSPYLSESQVTSYDLISEYSEYIWVIGEYLGDTWVNLVVNENGSISGKEFQLDGNRAYLIIATTDISLDLAGYGTSSVDISSYKGWTLVPKSLIGESSAEGIITNYKDVEINQVAVWNYSASKFEDLIQNEEGKFYGTNISLNNIDSVFVKIE